jgi:hypothetical protein
VEARQGRLVVARLLGEVCLERVRRPLEGEDGDDFEAVLRGELPGRLTDNDEEE